MPYPTAEEDRALVQAALSGQGGSTVVTGYQLGPLSAGADSPLGQLFGGLSDLAGNWGRGVGLASQNYAAGLALAINDPAAANFVLHADPSTQYTAAQKAEIAAASSKPLSANPFKAAGGIIGTILGTGANAAGFTIGTAGAAAAPGVSSGAQAGTAGVANVAAAGASGAFGGAIQGLGAGLSTTLSQNAGNSSLIFIAAVVLVIILASK